MTFLHSRFFTLLFVTATLWCHTTFAATPPDSIITKCTLTPSGKAAYVPKEFGMTNNLRQKTGSIEIAEGEPIRIYGRVFDRRCVPLSGVKVQLWHEDEKGNYVKQRPSELLRTLYKAPYFIGSGTADTNNIGHFTFYSIMPKNHLLHFRIHHPKHPPFTTNVFLTPSSENPTTGTGGSLTLSPTQAQGEKIYYLDITLDTPGEYRRY